MLSKKQENYPSTMEYYSATKKNSILLFAAFTCGCGGHYAKYKSEKYCMLIIYMWNLKNSQTSEYNKKNSGLTDTENKLVLISGGSAGESSGRTGGSNHWV